MASTTTTPAVANPTKAELQAQLAELQAALAEAQAATTKPKQTKADKQKAHVMEVGDRLAFVAANARPAKAACLCGCGNETKTRFFPGHDATLKRDLAATVAHGTEEAQAEAKIALAKFGW